MELEALGLLTAIIVSGIGCIFFIRFDWKRYGILYLLSAISGNFICFVLTSLNFYSFPNNYWHNDAQTPYLLVSTVFPLLVLFGVRYSPEKWKWKIAFYWVLIHLGVLGEVLLLRSSILEFGPNWHLWDSYSLWWIYYLLYELLGGKIIPPEKRKPLSSDSFRYGRWGWIVTHVVLVSTIFLAGVYVGWALF